MNWLFAREGGGFGDHVCAMAAVQGAKRLDPQADTTYLTLRPYIPLASRCFHTDRCLCVPPGGRRPTNSPLGERLSTYLRWNHRTFGVNTPDRWDRIVDLWCPADVHEHATNGRPTESRIESFCRAAGVVPETPELHLADAEQHLANETISIVKSGRPLILLGLHSANPLKDWPRGRFYELAMRLRSCGESVIATFTLGGTDPSVPHVRPTSILHLAALIERADLVISVDTATIHIAGALKTPCIGLFGSTHGAQMVQHFPTSVAIWHEEEASRLFGCHCPCIQFKENGYDKDGPCKQTARCMELITVDEVFRKAQEMIHV